MVKSARSLNFASFSLPAGRKLQMDTEVVGEKQRNSFQHKTHKRLCFMGVKLEPLPLPGKYGATLSHPTPCCLFCPGCDQSIQAGCTHAKKFVFTETGTQMFMGALFRLIIARRWKNPNIHQLMKEKQSGVYPDNGMLFAYKKKRRSDICHKMDESKRKKPVTKGHLWSYMISF